MEKGTLNYIPMCGPSAKSGWNVQIGSSKIFLHKDSEGFPFHHLCNKDVSGIIINGYFKIILSNNN